MSAPRLCAYCGGRVRFYPATGRSYNTATGVFEVMPHPLAGRPERGGATRMSRFDPDGLFCKMECAVRYGVRAARAKVAP